MNRRALLCVVCAALLGALPLAASLDAAPSPATPTPRVAECRPQSQGERPSATADDVANCVLERLGPARIRLTVAYTYASPLGRQNIFLGVDVLAGGNRLKWFGFRPVPLTASGGTASVEVVFGVNGPPARTLRTDQVEFYMYVGGGQIFYRETFALNVEWQL